MLHETVGFARVLLAMSLAATLAVLSNRVSAVTRVPAPLFFLAGAAVAVAVSGLNAPAQPTVQQIVTVCLVLILFDGGMHIGRARFRSAAGPILLAGVPGTFLTAAGVMVVAHLGFGFSWYAALLLGAVVAPTDPAVVFSVLGPREISGRSGTILEGESGANDPVGIALVASLLAAGRLSGTGIAHVAGEFALQMGVGLAFGAVGGIALLWFMRRVSLPSEGLYPLRTLAFVFVVYGLATVAHGSGFLSVFVVGIVIGDERAPFKREIERFHSAAASLAEIAAFLVLGLTVVLRDLVRLDVWLPAVLIAALLALVIRPLAVGASLVPAGLRRNEAAFVLFAGLKGAVPLVLGTSLLVAPVGQAQRLYGIVVGVVVLSVLFQGGLVPSVAGRLRLPVRLLQPQPWAFGVRLLDEPPDVLRVTAVPGAPAVGEPLNALGDVAAHPEELWVHLVVRDGRLLSTTGNTTVQAGDELVISADPGVHAELRRRLTAAG